MSGIVEMNQAKDFLRWESNYITDGVMKFIAQDERFSNLTDDQVNSILDDEKFAESLHGRFILNCVFTFLEQRGCTCSNRVCEEYLGGARHTGLEHLAFLDNEDIPSLCEKSHIEFLNSQYVYRKGKIVKVISKKNLVDKGAVYTQSTIARDIVDDTLNNLASWPESPQDIKILDFATGTGRFYTEVIRHVANHYSIDTETVALNSVYAIDLDPIALNITRLKAFSFLHNYSEDNLRELCNRIILRNGLLRESLTQTDSNAISSNDFGGLFNAGFDAIVSNPPYLVLKPNKKIPPKAWAVLQDQINYFRTSGVYTYSIEGMLNLYQISIESMLQMLKPGGEMGIICPSTLFADLSATRLRRYLLRQNKVRSIRYYAEKDDLFVNVIQATCIFHLKKGDVTDQIDVNDGNRKFIVPCRLIEELFPENMEIPNISAIEWDILRKLKQFEKLKNVTVIRSKRGELDLSLMISYVTRERTPYRLVRGNMVTENGISNDNGEYVLPSFVESKSSDYVSKDFGRKRLICQQISNAALLRRLVFCYCDNNDILGNSCNYISAEPSVLAKMKILLNSPLLNWRFKITSSNNHINNYELDELPIVNLDSIDLEKEFASRVELNEYVCGLYGLNKIETEYIRKYENL